MKFKNIAGLVNERVSTIDELMKYGDWDDDWDDESALNIFEVYVYSEIFSKTVKTYTIYDDKSIASNHLTLLNEFLSLGESLLPTIKEKLWEHCEFLFYMADYGAEFEGQTNYEFFNIFTLEDAYTESNLESVVIDIDENVCKIQFYPEWESEHGFVVEVVNGKLIFEPYDEDTYKEFAAYRENVERRSDKEKTSIVEEEEEKELAYTQTTLEVGTVIKQIRFNTNMASFSERFTEDDIIKALAHEDTLPHIKDVLPEDYVWYMQNYGSAYFEPGYILTQYNDETYINVNVMGLDEPVNIYRKYAYHTRTGSYEYRMENIQDDDNKLVLEKKYMPITNDGAILGTGMIVMDIEANTGSIWRIPPYIEFLNDSSIDHLTPYFVAENFTEFLKLLISYPKDIQRLKEKGFELGKKVTDYHLWRQV